MTIIWYISHDFRFPPDEQYFSKCFLAGVLLLYNILMDTLYVTLYTDNFYMFSVLCTVFQTDQKKQFQGALGANSTAIRTRYWFRSISVSFLRVILFSTLYSLCCITTPIDQQAKTAKHTCVPHCTRAQGVNYKIARAYMLLRETVKKNWDYKGS